MKILIASTPQKLRRTKHLWAELDRQATVELHILGQGTYANLGDLVERCNFSGFDRVIVDHNLRRMGSEFQHLRRIPNLVIFEFDFWMNYIAEAGCEGKLKSILRALPAHRIIVSGSFIKDDLRADGFDAEYSPKGYDANFVSDLGQPRDITVGFVGRSKQRAYRRRREMLAWLRAEAGLQALKTEENEQYNQALNRIRIFVCPDLGYRELMIKNLEALAAGCALVTPRPEPEEMERLGFVDGENVVCYASREGAVEQIKRLRGDPDRVRRIGQAGRELATARHRWEFRAAPILQMLQPPLRKPPVLTLKDRWNLLTLRMRPSKYA